MTRFGTLVAKFIGDRDHMETDRYFMIVVCLTASIFLMFLCGIHVIMNLRLPPVFFAGGSSLVMLGLYYFLRFRGCLFYPKLTLTLFGLIMLDLTWYTKYMSNGPVLFFILIFGALVIWVWQGRSLLVMLGIYVINIAILFVIDSHAPEYRFAYPEGRIRSVDIFLSFLLYSSLMIFLLYVVKDEFTRQKEKAIRSDKLKSSFLANMSHEIRTPMNAIVGFSQLLSISNSRDENQKYTNIIQKSSDNLLSLINDIIDLSKIEAGDMEIRPTDFSVRDLFDELRHYYTIELSKRGKSAIRLDYSLPDGLTVIRSDPLRIKQVLSNLLNNAMKFTEEGEIIFSLIRKGDEFQFSVKDSGAGIKPEDQQSIFEQFTMYNYRDMNAEGTGIGLSIVKRIVEMLDGGISLDSKEGKGSTFTFTIPYLPPSSRLKPEQKSIKISLSAIDQPAKPILVVEDEKSSYMLLEAMLNMLNLDFHHVTNGRDALSYIRTNTNVRLVLMDLRLPEPDGFETAKAIKEMIPGITIIAQTAYAMVGDRERALEAGCDDYIAKPLDLNKLQDLIRKYLSG